MVSIPTEERIPRGPEYLRMLQELAKTLENQPSPKSPTDTITPNERILE